MSKVPVAEFRKPAVIRPGDRINNIPKNHANVAEMYRFYMPLHKSMYESRSADPLRSFY